jgi:FliI/YscN family ATPase
MQRLSFDELPGDTLSKVEGRVHTAVGLSVKAHLPGAKRGDWVRIRRRGAPTLDAEVVAFSGTDVTLLPLGDPHGVGPDDVVEPVASSFAIRCSDALIGRVLDGTGQPIDGGPPIASELWPVRRPAPRPSERPRITRVMPTGVRAIDGLCTLGVGQRIGILAGSGVGKSTLLCRLAAHADAEVIVFGLVGERGRELEELVFDMLTPDARARSVVVCATSDEPPLVRMKSAHVATAIAEYFRARGKHVVLLIDSLTRFVRAARDVGLAAGEPPARRGFPPSAFAELAPLIERAGLTRDGAITGFYTVLVEGGDLDEPVTDEVRGLVDGHLILDRRLAERGHFPPIDVVKSLSRLSSQLMTPAQTTAAARVRRLLSHHEAKRDLLELGAYARGSDALLDRAIERLPELHAFLDQEPGEESSLSDTLMRVVELG